MIAAGKFDKKGMLERRDLTTDSIGEEIESWSTLEDNVWAQINQYLPGSL